MFFLRRFFLIIFVFYFCVECRFALELRALEEEWGLPFLSLRLQNILELSISEAAAAELLFLSSADLKPLYTKFSENNLYSFRTEKSRGLISFCSGQLCTFRESFFFGNLRDIQFFRDKFLHWQQILEESGFMTGVLREEKSNGGFEAVLWFKIENETVFLDGRISLIEPNGNLFRGFISFLKR